MNNSGPINTVCILPHLQGVGGPASFYIKITDGLRKKGYTIAAAHDLNSCKSMLVIGGTNRLDLLFSARKNGIRIVQRLNGMNWLHRLRYTGVHHFLKSEQNNLLLAFIRRYVADEIVYQSEFSRWWWNSRFQKTPAGERVIYNGVNTAEYTPGDGASLPDNLIRILVVEGRMGSGHQYGISNGIDLCTQLAGIAGKPVELVIVGDVPLKDRRSRENDKDVSIKWMGIVPRDKIPDLDRSAHLMFSAELNAACPNSLIEGLACGLPVVGFNVGSVSELIGENAGEAVPYGGNHWKLEKPDIGSLARAAAIILANPEPYRSAARERALKLFSAERMVELYINALVN